MKRDDRFDFHETCRRSPVFAAFDRASKIVAAH